MRLRCLGEMKGAPFVVGRFYEVVEILEMSEHVMVKMPSGRWPKPGGRWFGWHPEDFLSAGEGV